jgi:predicted nucleic acid-binding Zn ribbon protein
MRKSNTQTIASVIKDYLKEAQIEGKLKEVQVVNSWEELVGKVIARRTNRIYIKNGKLYLHMNSSIVKNELLMHREGIIERINTNAGEEIVKEIVIR